ncbi:MAG: hypothetical protein HHJ17_16035 [Rhodoferax sp.]|uniref:hypothetical protein n=1 Tax=Rhodoferax sp. TaxID=50421 RepID=UPI0017E35A2D|nr:hypothetical protein [Rhodoferax sp.]NMM15030.1 hypothetical protein [Rhodoferax sp.]
MKPIRLILRASMAASAMALLAGTALAQSGAGAGGPAATPAMPASGMGMGPGMGAGMGPGMGRGHMAQWGMDYTPGWSMMTRAERNEHREHMRAFKTYEECTAYRDQVHEKMAARIKEKGGKPLAQPRRDACAGLKP